MSELRATQLTNINMWGKLICLSEVAKRLVPLTSSTAAATSAQSPQQVISQKRGENAP